MAQINPESFKNAASLLLAGQATLPSRAIGKAMLGLYPGTGATDEFSDTHEAHIAFLRESLKLEEGGLLEWEKQHTLQEAADVLNAAASIFRHPLVGKTIVIKAKLAAQHISEFAEGLGLMAKDVTEEMIRRDMVADLGTDGTEVSVEFI